MALAQDETISLRFLGVGGIETKHTEIERRQDVGDRHVAAWMPLLGTVDHSERKAPDLTRLCNRQFRKRMRGRHLKSPKITPVAQRTKSGIAGSGRS